MTNALADDVAWGSDEYLITALDIAESYLQTSPDETAEAAARMRLIVEDHDDDVLVLGAAPTAVEVHAHAYKADQMWSLAGIQSLPQEERDDAWAAVRKELQSHVDNDTWLEVATLPTGAKAIKTRGFLIRKPIRVDGKIRYKFKYRLVVCGYSQDDTHFDKSDSPVISMCALHLFLAVCASEQLDLFHGDFVTAFLKSFIEEGIDLYARLPDNLPNGLGGKLVKILRAWWWYGLKQSSRLHFNTTVELIKSFGFEQSGTEPCVFNLVLDGRTTQLDGSPLRRKWPAMMSNNTNVCGERMWHTIRLGLYVDDIPMGITRGNPVKDQFLAHLQTVFEVKIEPMSFFLNCEIDYDKEKRTIYLSQRMHTLKCIEMIMGTNSGIKSTKTPMEPGYHPNTKGIADDDVDFMGRQNRTERYRTMTCSLLWLTRTRPDIAFAVTMLCKFLKNPRPQHWADLKHIARYLAGTSKRGLCFKPDSMVISAYSDSDWATDPTSRRSVSGSILLLGGSPVYTKSQQQKIVALSSMEAETYALSGTCQTVVYSRRLMGDFGYPQMEPTLVRVDNQATISMAKSILISWRTRHIPIRDLQIRDLCLPNPVNNACAAVFIDWIDTKLNFADGPTKSQSVADFESHLEFHTAEVPG
jgi:hypothetical protein